MSANLFQFSVIYGSRDMETFDILLYQPNPPNPPPPPPPPPHQKKVIFGHFWLCGEYSKSIFGVILRDPENHAISSL